MPPPYTDAKCFNLMNDENSLFNRNDELLPSSFAMYARTLLTEKERNVIIPGCGNGADALFFAGENYNVLAISEVEEDIKYLNQHHKYFKNIRFLYADHTQLLNESILYDMVYSRSVLNKLSDEEQNQLLRWSYRHLKNGARLCIETSGKIKTAFDTASTPQPTKEKSHLRVIDFKAICTQLESLGFNLDFAKEEKLFSPHKTDEETLIRIVARKKK